MPRTSVSLIRRPTAAVALILAAMVPLSGCASFDSTPSPVGTWGPTEGAHLQLAEDGALSGSDGCNRLIGTWQGSGEALEFVGVGSTAMLCEGVDDWLSGLATGSVDGDTLTVFGVDGGQIGTLDRQ